MWTARILLLIGALLTAGGWFDGMLTKSKKTALLCAAPIVLGLSFVPTLREPSVRLCFAPCAFALLVFALCPTGHPLGALCAAVLGGLIGAKLTDTYPLFPEPGILTAAPTTVLAALYCRDRSAKALAVAAAPFIMLLFQAIGDYTLFQSTVLELGNGDALCAEVAGSAMILAAEMLRTAFKKRGFRTISASRRKVARREPS